MQWGKTGSKKFFALTVREDGLLEQEGRLTLLRQIHQLPELQREVDYLKRVKLRNDRRVIAAVVCTALVLVTALLVKLFLNRSHSSGLLLPAQL